MNERLYLLKIRLVGIEPEIWRRFVVPADITLDRLHEVIQIVMGWNDNHFYEFTVGKKRYSEDPESKEEGLVAGRYRLGDLIKQKRRTFRYLHDFGDSWEHEIVLEDNRYFTSEPMGELSCIGGARACPPEDVGGRFGYIEFCQALNDPNHEEHEMSVICSGGHFDSERFDFESVDLELLKHFLWSPPFVAAFDRR